MAHPLDGVTLSAGEGAALVGLTPRRLQQLASDGVVPRPERGRYPALDLVQGILRFMRDEERRTSKSASASRVQEMRSEEIALRIETNSKALVNEAVREAISTFDLLAGGLRSDLLAIPARVATDLEQRRKIETQIDEAFGAAAKRAAQADAARGPGGEPVDPASRKPPRRVGRKPRVPAKRRPARKA